MPFFEVEAVALKQIKTTNTIRVPNVITFGKTASSSFLVLEFIEEGSTSPKGQELMGKQLACDAQKRTAFFRLGKRQLHWLYTSAKPKVRKLGGFLPQHRLQHQLQLAAQKGRSFDKAERLLLNLEYFFETYSPQPSLLHGDLWGGNASHDSSGNPFIFDPATYYGDREADIAFTYMFGGFSSSFYQGYEKEFPLDEGFR